MLIISEQRETTQCSPSSHRQSNSFPSFSFWNNRPFYSWLRSMTLNKGQCQYNQHVMHYSVWCSNRAKFDGDDFNCFRGNDCEEKTHRQTHRHTHTHRQTDKSLVYVLAFSKSSKTLKTKRNAEHMAVDYSYNCQCAKCSCPMSCRHRHSMQRTWF